jgi:hypothetical protein
LGPGESEVAMRIGRLAGLAAAAALASFATWTVDLKAG